MSKKIQPEQGPSTYKWNFDGTTLAATGTQVTVLIPEKTSAILSVLETNEKGCVSKTPSSLSIAINPRPIPINIRALPSSDLCIGDDYQVLVDVQPGIEFIWSAIPSTMIETLSNINQLDLKASQSGVISVLAKNTATSCTSLPSERLSIPITVHELPIKPEIVGKDTISCSAEETYNVKTPNVSSKYVWQYGLEAKGVPTEGDTTTSSSAIVDFGPRRAEVEVIEINEFGCVSALATKNPLMIGCDPRADFKLNASSYCLGEPVIITENASYTPENIEPLTMWFILKGSTTDSVAVLPGASISVIYNTPGTYDIRMIIQQSGKADTLDSIGVVVIKPLATIGTQTLVGQKTICQNFEGNYTISPTNLGSIYSWSHSGALDLTGNLSSTTKNLRFGPSSKDVTITIIENRNGCKDTLEQIIDVLPSPEIRVLDGLKSICEGAEFTLTLRGAPTSSKYLWNPNANIVSYNADSTAANFLFNSAGSYKVSVLETNVNGCFSIDSTSFATIEVKPVPSAPTIGGSGLGGICEGASAEFTTQNNTALVYNWIVTTPDKIVQNNGSKITISPSGTGTKTVKLAVTDNGCISDTLSANYEVQKNPDAPKIIAKGTNFCEGETATFSVENPIVGSNFCWTTPANTSIVEGFICGEDNSSIKVKFGSTSGSVTVKETTGIGCNSITPGSALATIQKLLGQGSILKFFQDSICSARSLENEAMYKVKFPNATSVTYEISPAIIPSAYTIIANGDSAQMTVVFPSEAEGTSFTVKAIAKAGTCDTKEIPWKVVVKNSVPVTVSIDNRDVCEGDNVVFTASINPNSDPKASFDWYLNDVFQAKGKSHIFKNIEDNDAVEVRYTSGKGFCPDLGTSVMKTNIRIQAWLYPEVDGFITGDGVIQKTDKFGDVFYQVNTRQEIDLEAELVNKGEVGAIYNYSFYWKDGFKKSFSNISAPVGIIPNTGTILTPASLSNLLSGQKERWYYVETNVNGICSQSDSMLIKINFEPWIPSVVKPGCGCLDGIWTIDNIIEFPKNTVVIFNRWGNVVRTYGPGEFVSWDGTNSSGEALPVGTYYYTVDLGEGGSPCTGPLTLLR